MQNTWHSASIINRKKVGKKLYFYYFYLPFLMMFFSSIITNVTTVHDSFEYILIDDVRSCYWITLQTGKYYYITGTYCSDMEALYDVKRFIVYASLQKLSTLKAGTMYIVFFSKHNVSFPINKVLTYKDKKSQI